MIIKSKVPGPIQTPNMEYSIFWQHGTPVIAAMLVFKHKP